jgi:formate C-acetyltransferase
MAAISPTLTRPAETEPLSLELDPASRSYRLRQAYWQRRHYEALKVVPLAGCGEETLVGYAKDFATLLEASDPCIQPDELIVGSSLAIPAEGSDLKLGYYNSHYPPGFATLLGKGLVGIRDEARQRLASETDPQKRDFLASVEISYAAAIGYVARYAAHARALAEDERETARRAELTAIAAVCDELTHGVPRSFHAALQLVQFTRIFGGRGCIGRFDQWLYPFLQRDLASGALSRAQAQELVECSFLKMNEFGSAPEATYEAEQRGGKAGGASNDNLRNIALAGQTPSGADACNELTYLCMEASGKLMLPEPKINVRFYSGSPERLLHACCQVVAKGSNVLAFFNDEVALPALLKLGIPVEDARDYCNDGCSELIMGGRGTIWFQVYDSLTALTNLAHRSKNPPYPTFDAFLAAFKQELSAFMPEGPGEDNAVTFPFFAAGIEDCLAKASPTGVRYSIHGAILAQVGNSADGLAAIRKLVYEDQAITWEQLAEALSDDFDGHEALRQMILHRAPKYGNDQDGVDALVREIAEFYCDGVHARAHNPQGYGPKRAPGLMCFGLQQKKDLPASPDGRRKGDPTANSFSPAIGMDRSGPTAVLKSVSKVDLSRASHGSVLDVALHASVMRGEQDMAKLAALVRAFLGLPCTTTLQLNVIDRETLLRARANPTAEEFKTLIVRVWGFSAVFVDLPAALQDHVLARTEHGTL